MVIVPYLYTFINLLVFYFCNMAYLNVNLWWVNYNYEAYNNETEVLRLLLT